MLPPCSRSRVLQMLSPRPVPSAGTLGGEERIEDVGQIFGRDSRAVILKHDAYRLRPAFYAHANRAFLTVFADGLFRVQQEIQEYLHQLIGIGHDHGQRRLGQKIDRDAALAQGGRSASGRYAARVR
jgi:hypothetical protein